MADVSIGAEIQALPLGFILSAPLTAAIDAQALSAANTINFIQSLGTDDFGEVRTMIFNYESNFAEPGGEVTSRDVTLTVPLLSMVEAPHIAIEDLTVGFEFTIRDVMSTENSLKLAGKFETETAVTSETTTKLNMETSGLASFLYGKASGGFENKTTIAHKTSLSVSAAYQRTSRHETDRRATLKMNMTAKQRVPEGFQRVLTIFADAISAQVPLPPVPA